ncbi:hypothetical protein [Faecalibacter bovis]|uniref:Uncharacterized protein n=1 Tax=Faecalibacter bovis TaxID=2898187 RepID=A0ABX7XAX3_9FLAO|nr:hypothetical protein [Faecalibacter bovis]QTV05035.1 hypothetical protein J9309_09565 [Faecalibacter bovis]
MNHKFFLLFILILLFEGCQIQKSNFNNDFNWTIDFPVEYNRVSNTDWLEKVQQSGELIEKYNNVEFKNQSVPIFIFKSKSDYFESTRTKYEGSRENYINYLTENFQLQIQPLKDEIPEIKIDYAVDTISISNLEFFYQKSTIIYPNGAKRTLESFNRLFEDNNELSINIIYVDKEFGDKFKFALLNSSFEK